MVLGAEHWGMRNRYLCQENPAPPSPTKSMTPTKSNKEDKLSQEERRVRAKKELEPTRYSCVRGGK